VGIGALALSLHLTLHALPGLEEGQPFRLSDQGGTALVLVGVLVDWVAVRRWMANQRARLQALAPALGARPASAS
jgi:hypothetical protein